MESKFKFPLVTMADDGEPRASSEVIAKGVKQQHASVIKLIRKHQVSFEGFGPLGFEIRKGRALRQGGFAKGTEFAMLNEHQAGLLISFMRNTEPVIDFKVALIREFFRMRDALERRDMTVWRRRQELEIRDAESKVRASFGSHLMLERKRDIPDIDTERALLKAQMEPPLFLN